MALVSLASAGLAQAAVSPFWQELGGSASGTGVSQTSSPALVFDGSVAVGPDGRPVVVYTEYPDDQALQGAITVKQWTGSAWQTLGGPSGVADGYEPQVQVSAAGDIYVAWLTDDGSGNSEVRLRMWNGSAFVALGSSDSPGGLSGANAGITPPFSLALDDSGNPIVAFLAFAETGIVEATATPAIVDSTIQVYVRRWNGSDWQFVGGGFTGTDGFAGGGASNARSFLSGATAILHDVDTPSLAVDADGQPVVAFTYFTMIDGQPAANTDIYVTRWNGTAWVAVGPAVPATAGAAGTPSRGGAGGVSASATGSFNPSLAADATGKLALAWEEEPVNGGVYVWTRLWNGSAWVQLASSATGTGLTQAGTVNVLPRVGLDTLGRPIVTWSALTVIQNPAQIFVRRWNGSTAWEELGFHSAREAGISDAAVDALAPVLALAAGVPTIAWLDVNETGSGQVFLRQFFSGTTFALTTRLAGSGTLTSDPIGVQCSSGSCVAPFPDGTTVTLLPQSAPGWRFSGWADACSGNGSCTVAMTAARSVNASFIAVQGLTLAVATPAGTSGQGTVGSIAGPAGTCPFGGGAACAADVARGALVTLQATAATGNRFLSWSGGPCSGRTSATCAFTMTANVSTTALFRGVTGVRVTKAGNGAGTVSGTGVSCGADCFEEVFTGTSVTLTPAPATGSSFVGWTGDCNNPAASPCVVAAIGLNRSVTATFQLKKQRLTVTATGAGIATSNPAGIDCGDGGHAACTFEYDYGTVVTLTPQPAIDSMLSSWTGCTSLSGSVCTATMTANRTIAPRFVAAHTLSVAASGNGSGRITTTTPPGLTCVSNCSVSQLFPATASVVLTPQPAVGTNFHWTGGVCSGTGACTTPLSANRSAVGQFTLNRHSLVVTSRPSGNVRNDPAGSLYDCGNGASACSGVFDYGTAITLTATPDAGFAFVNWTGTACAGSTSPVCPITLKANVTVTPNFRARTFVTVVKAGTGAGTVSGPGISCGADCSEAEFDARPVTLTAAPAVGSRFTGFAGACSAATSPCTFTPAGNNQTVTATFTLIPYVVTVADRTNGAAVSDPLADGIACGAAAAGGTGDCTATLDFGTPVVLRATAITGSRFVNWTGTVCAGSTNATCAFKIPAAGVAVSPNFKDVTAVTLTKTGQGTVSSSPAGISCGLPCATASYDFARNAVVKLTPTPAVGWSFDGFSGACTGPTCSFSASTPAALVGADFSIQHRRLAVTVVGQGSVGGGAACDAGSTPCLLDFDYGTSLVLTATAAPGYRFTGWSQNCAGTGTCSASMTVDRSVTATFKPQFGLTVSKPGNSTGTITSSPAGINCGADCSETYLGGTVVTLIRSAPITGTTFRWGGDCAFRGTNATCALALNANASVDADYSLQQLNLTVVKNGGALGSVSGLGGGIACGADCSEVVDYGTPVVLAATPGSSPAAEFVSWAGCASAATNASCSFTMTAARTVTASFRPLVSSVAVEALSTSTLAVGAVRQLSAVATFTDDSRQDVTASPETIWTSSVPAVATVSKTGLVTGKTAGNTSVTATFRSHAAALPVEVATLSTATTTPIVVSCSPYGDDSLDPGRLACLPSGLNFSVYCQATGTYASGSQEDITDQVAWVTSSAAIAQPTGLVAFNSPVRQSFRIVGNGTATLRATLGGKTSPTTGTLGTSAWVVQGAAATVTGVEVTPPAADVQAGSDRQLTATATLTGSGTCAAPPARDFSTVTTWTSSDDSVADVSFFGRVTGIAPGGPVTITATYPVTNGQDLTGDAAITVTTP